MIRINGRMSLWTKHVAHRSPTLLPRGVIVDQIAKSVSCVHVNAFLFTVTHIRSNKSHRNCCCRSGRCIQHTWCGKWIVDNCYIPLLLFLFLFCLCFCFCSVFVFLVERERAWETVRQWKTSKCQRKASFKVVEYFCPSTKKDCRFACMSCPDGFVYIFDCGYSKLVYVTFIGGTALFIGTCIYVYP